MRAPDYAEPLVGWRVWLAVETAAGVRLSSVIHEEVWPTGEPLRARCRSREDLFAPPVDPHAAPDPDCGCGVHAAREPARVLGYLKGRDEPRTLARVLGTVALWGDVVEHEHGWRGALAYPATILVPPAAGALREGLRSYGVPVRLLAAAA